LRQYIILKRYRTGCRQEERQGESAGNCRQQCRCRQKTRPGTDRRGKRHCRLQIGETRLVIDRKGRTGHQEYTSGDKPGAIAREGALRRYSTTSTYRAVNGVPKLGNP
jgi:hypothetical protein